MSDVATNTMMRLPASELMTMREDFCEMDGADGEIGRRRRGKQAGTSWPRPRAVVASSWFDFERHRWRYVLDV